VETLANLESFVRSADSSSFSKAARYLGLTPAAVSRNVAMLERNLGVRLFQRSTRKLTLTEIGERFLLSVGPNLVNLQAAITDVSAETQEPLGVLKVSMSRNLGLTYVMPILPAFLAKYPGVKPEWHFENRPVDLVSEGYDIAIGGGFDLAPGVVARALAPAHIVAVASPGYLAGRSAPQDPGDLRAHSGIIMRSLRTGRLRLWTLRNGAGTEMPGSLAEKIIVNDTTVLREAAQLGLGIAMIAVSDIVPELESGELVRLLPDWYADAGLISLYYSSKTHMPMKTRVFVDAVSEEFRRLGLAERFSGAA
jgi:DNA-binding transcriptional LysR family regulator